VALAAAGEARRTRPRATRGARVPGHSIQSPTIQTKPASNEHVDRNLLRAGRRVDVGPGVHRPAVAAEYPAALQSFGRYLAFGLIALRWPGWTVRGWRS